MSIVILNEINKLYFLRAGASQLSIHLQPWAGYWKSTEDIELWKCNIN